MVMDLLRSKRALIAENAMLRQQLIVATRRIKRPRFTTGDRVVLVLLSMVFTRWREVLLLVRPETLLRWHRRGFRLLDHMIVWSEHHLQRVLDEYRHFYNDARPHQGIEQRQPAQFSISARSATPVAGGTVTSRAVLGGLHHDYRRQLDRLPRPLPIGWTHESARTVA
jgi:hypothetical protein